MIFYVRNIFIRKVFNNSLISLVAISAINKNSRLVCHNGSSPVRTANGFRSYNDMTKATDKNVKKTREASKLILKSNIVCFDVDSTVIREEEIDDLAKYCGKGIEVEKMSQEAMDGKMLFQEFLKRSFDIFRPTQKQIKEFIISHPSTLSPGIQDVINGLKQRNIPVYLISGSFDCLIEPIAKRVGIPMDRVFANKLFFYFNGDYAGFDTTQPTSRSGGKSEVITMIRRQYGSNTKITMVGDGATDLEASPPADYFIGYGGNIIRETVRKRSQYFVTDFTQLMAEWE